MPSLGLGLGLGNRGGGGGLDSLFFQIVAEDQVSTTIRMSPALLRSQDDVSAEIFIPARNFISQDAISVTVEA